MSKIEISFYLTDGAHYHSRSYDSYKFDPHEDTTLPQSTYFRCRSESIVTYNYKILRSLYITVTRYFYIMCTNNFHFYLQFSRWTCFDGEFP